jgi:hypothetical protein
LTVCENGLSSGNDLTYRVESLARLRSRSCIIDGEAVCCGDDGVPSFDRIRYRRHDASVVAYLFYLKDSGRFMPIAHDVRCRVFRSGDRAEDVAPLFLGQLLPIQRRARRCPRRLARYRRHSDAMRIPSAGCWMLVRPQLDRGFGTSH